MTVREALNIGRLKEGKVIAGEKGLDRIVSYIDVLEVPDVINWLRGEELLLTTGYSIKDKPDVQEKLILELAKINAAGIIIKLNRFLDSIPEVMVKQANEVNLPIIELPPDVPYIEVTHPLLKEILMRQNKEKWVSEKLKEILYSEFLESVELRKRLALINSNFESSRFMVLMVISYDNSWHLKKILKISDFYQSPNVIAGEVDGNYVIIHKLDFSSDWRQKIIYNFLNLENIGELKGDITCLISALITSPLQLQIEYKRLIKALKSIHKLPEKNIYYFYDDIVHQLFLNEVSKMEVAKEFVNYVLKPFRNFSEKEREVLLNTLYTYVVNGGNMSKASKECFLHRNTLIYRVNKLKKVLKSDIDNPEEHFKYALAIVLKKLMDQKD